MKSYIFWCHCAKAYNLNLKVLSSFKNDFDMDFGPNTFLAPPPLRCRIDDASFRWHGCGFRQEGSGTRRDLQPKFKIKSEYPHLVFAFFWDLVPEKRNIAGECLNWSFSLKERGWAFTCKSVNHLGFQVPVIDREILSMMVWTISKVCSSGKTLRAVEVQAA